MTRLIALIAAAALIAGGAMLVYASGESGPSGTDTAVAHDATLAGDGASARSSQSLGSCAVLPSNDAFHQDVSGLDVAANSAAIIGRADGSDLHPDFGANPHYGIPYAVVGPSQRKIAVHIRRGSGYPGQSDKGRRPIPPKAKIEGGKHSNDDRHTLVVQRAKNGGSCKLTELYRAKYDGGKGHRWSADQVSAFNLGKELPQRPKGWTSADAAGLPILPGLVRYGEVKNGLVDHAIRITFGETRAAYRSPATHFASDSCSSNLPAMGDRLRLKSDYPIASMSHDSKVIATALKTYGAIVADNGSDFYISGSTDGRWKDSHLDGLRDIPGSAFEVLDTGQPLTLSSGC
ncbi:hypothetical protein BH10ACT11_BH10ACT11_20980 [soil metagenome]